MRFKTLGASLAAAATALAGIAAAPAVPPPAATATADDVPTEHTATEVMIDSRRGDIQLDATVFRPAGSSARNRVPMVLHSHGWGGAKSNSIDSFADYLDAGFGVLSFSQRGHGNSGGEANVEDPDFEGLDNQGVNDFVASLDWVARDFKVRLPDDEIIDRDDPVMFAIGGSYGGGYQLLNAFMDEREYGASRLDAIAPEITWYDLNESLAPSDVPRILWLTLLVAGAPTIPDWVYAGYTEGLTTGTYPRNIRERFTDSAPSWWTAQGITLDIPTVIGQGHNDNLFNFNQGWQNFTESFSEDARARSIFIGYNGGHTLPGVLPVGEPGNSVLGTQHDACSGEEGFRGLARSFFSTLLAGEHPHDLVEAPVGLSTTEGRCVHLDTLTQTEVVDVGLVDTTTLSTTVAGTPLQLELLSGPATVAGIATFEGTLAALSLLNDATVFVGLSKGTSPLDAQIIQNNMVPLRSSGLEPGLDFSLDLNGIAVDLAEGEKLYLTISAINEQFLLMGPRIPGAMVFTDTSVRVPVVD